MVAVAEIGRARSRDRCRSSCSDEFPAFRLHAWYGGAYSYGDIFRRIGSSNYYRLIVQPREALFRSDLQRVQHPSFVWDIALGAICRPALLAGPGVRSCAHPPVVTAAPVPHRLRDARPTLARLRPTSSASPPASRHQVSPSHDARADGAVWEFVGRTASC